MAVSRIKEWVSGEVLNASDLNTELDNLNQTASAFPLTENVSAAGYAISNAVLGTLKQLNENVYCIDNYASFAAAISGIGSAVSTLLINKNVNVTANATVPSTLTLWFVGAGKLTVSVACTVTINGPIRAEPRQIFDGSGVIALTSNYRQSTANVEWWGATGDGSTNDRASIQAAITAMATAPMGGTLLFRGATYLVSTALNLKDKVNLLGVGMFASVIKGGVGIATTQGVLTGLTADSVSQVFIRDLGIDGSSASHTNNVRGIQVTSGSYVTIERVRVYDTYGIGILLSGTTDSKVIDCVIDTVGQGNGDHGIQFNNGSLRGIIARNNITNADGFGIRVAAETAATTDCIIQGNQIVKHASVAASVGKLECIGVVATCNRTKIIGNTCQYGGDNGISVSADECEVVGNTCVDNQYHGISITGSPANSNCTVVGNVCKNNNQAGGATRAGIGFAVSGLTNMVVTGNRCFDDQGTQTQDFGIKFIGTETGTVIQGNNLSGNLTAGIGGTLPSLATNYIRDNYGFATEAKGTGSIASGATTATISHGLAVTPAAANISVVFTEQGTNDYGRWWISGISSTQFTVNVSADPGASNLDFSWQATVI